MNARVRRLVRERARNRCEYCHLHQDHEPLYRLQIEHIVPRKHRGSDSPGNLALACYHCNLHKGPNLTGIDPATDRVTRVFHPRRDNWDVHFHWVGPMLVGSTPLGRVTVEVFNINARRRVRLRKSLIAAGEFPVT